MKKKINFSFLIFFNLTIIYFLKDYIYKSNIVKTDIAKIYFLIGTGIFLNFIVILFSKKNLSAEKKFLIIGTVIGIIYILVSPLLKGIDECAHFSRVYSFFLDGEMNNVGDYKIPKVIFDTYNNSREYSLIDSKIINNDLVISNDLKGARLYTPLSYLPFLFPVYILGFLIKTNIFNLIISTRFCGFLVYLFSSFYAIKIMPKRKDFMALFCLMPIVLSSGATITADLLTNSSIIVFISIWYRLYYDKKKITIKDTILIIICGILAGYSKMVYALEFLLVSFLPKECFETNKKKLKIIGSIFIVLMLATFINVFVAASSIDNSYDGFKLQKEFILKNPIVYIVILVNNILQNYNFFYSFTTNYTILHNIFRPSELAQIVYFVALLISIYQEKADLKLSKFKIFSIIFIGFIIISIIYTSLYLQWTSEEVGIGGEQICGMQSRYYIPVMLMFLVCLPSKKDTLNIDNDIPYYLSLWVNVTILINILLRVI